MFGLLPRLLALFFVVYVNNVAGVAWSGSLKRYQQHYSVEKLTQGPFEGPHVGQFSANKFQGHVHSLANCQGGNKIFVGAAGSVVVLSMPADAAEKSGNFSLVQQIPAPPIAGLADRFGRYVAVAEQTCNTLVVGSRDHDDDDDDDGASQVVVAYRWSTVQRMYVVDRLFNTTTYAGDGGDPAVQRSSLLGGSHQPFAVSADGTVLVLAHGPRVYYRATESDQWTRGFMMRPQPDPGPADGSSRSRRAAVSVSGDGSTVLMTVARPNSGHFLVWIWRQSAADFSEFCLLVGQYYDYSEVAGTVGPPHLGFSNHITYTGNFAVVGGPNALTRGDLLTFPVPIDQNDRWPVASVVNCSVANIDSCTFFANAPIYPGDSATGLTTTSESSILPGFASQVYLLPSAEMILANDPRSGRMENPHMALIAYGTTSNFTFSQAPRPPSWPWQMLPVPANDSFDVSTLTVPEANLVNLPFTVLWTDNSSVVRLVSCVSLPPLPSRFSPHGPFLFTHVAADIGARVALPPAPAKLSSLAKVPLAGCSSYAAAPANTADSTLQTTATTTATTKVTASPAIAEPSSLMQSTESLRTPSPPSTSAADNELVYVLVGVGASLLIVCIVAAWLLLVVLKKRRRADHQRRYNGVRYQRARGTMTSGRSSSSAVGSSSSSRRIRSGTPLAATTATTRQSTSSFRSRTYSGPLHTAHAAIIGSSSPSPAIAIVDSSSSSSSSSSSGTGRRRRSSLARTSSSSSSNNNAVAMPNFPPVGSGVYKLAPGLAQRLDNAADDDDNGDADDAGQRLNYHRPPPPSDDGGPFTLDHVPPSAAPALYQNLQLKWVCQCSNYNLANSLYCALCSRDRPKRLNHH